MGWTVRSLSFDKVRSCAAANSLRKEAWGKADSPCETAMGACKLDVPTHGEIVAIAERKPQAIVGSSTSWMQEKSR